MASSEVEKDSPANVAVVHTEATNMKQAQDSSSVTRNEVCSVQAYGFVITKLSVHD
jgi:hypothetical protein